MCDITGRNPFHPENIIIKNVIIVLKEMHLFGRVS